MLPEDGGVRQAYISDGPPRSLLAIPCLQFIDLFLKVEYKVMPQVIDANPGHVKALYRRGMAYMASGDFEEANSDFKMMIKLDKSSEPDATAALLKLKQKKQMAAVQMNLKKLWMVHVKGVGSPSSGLLVVEYFQLLGYEDVPFCECTSTKLDKEESDRVASHSGQEDTGVEGHDREHDQVKKTDSEHINAGLDGSDDHRTRSGFDGRRYRENLGGDRNQKHEEQSQDVHADVLAWPAGEQNDDVFAPVEARGHHVHVVCVTQVALGH
ncbi:hypothetical protein FEM48_Zijuj11G0100100 [Ziziphus jujuba var. spinosa]|uniref:Uncharacterized protein n=1 Tax=Ziziphus jujuba var. spinosa TaxID=714518 RepID=A0A978UIA7_ZIZJJ|nr:hypothetical protein FEM48_Zijuj11G0100100 [Ziziphus jujuba var. spinosa]